MGLPVDPARDSRRRVVRAAASLTESPRRRPPGRLDAHPLMRTAPSQPPADTPPQRSLAPQQAVGVALVLAGVVAMMLGWWGMSGTEDLLHQFSYLMSGGVIGAAVVAVGLTVLLSHEHARDRADLAEVLVRLEQIEGQMCALVDRPTPDPRPTRATGAAAPVPRGGARQPRTAARRPPA